MNTPTDNQKLDSRSDEQRYLDLSAQYCPQSLLSLKRALYKGGCRQYRVRLRRQSVSDVQRWLDLTGHHCQLLSVSGSNVELVFNWNGIDA